jgi:ubiquinone/menaquinone biosynthesis C-methylase UbiE
MDGSFAHNLQVWAEPATAEVADRPARAAAPSPRPLPIEAADELFAQETLRTLRDVRRRPVPEEPFSLAWYERAEKLRHERNGRWLPKLLEFGKHGGETLLGLGDGLGTDWVSYARHGSSVTVCTPSAEQLALVRRNFELRGLAGQFLHAPAWHLPLGDATIDVVCLHGVLPEAEDPQRVVAELYRVLRPGGKVLAVVPARYDVDFWVDAWFPWQRWFRRRPAGPSPRRYAARGLRQEFAPFVEHRVYKRHLRRGDVPQVWRWLPNSWLERSLGRLLVLKAFKPVSAARPVRAAA